MKRRLPFIGLTGGVASGKSTVADLLRKRGYAVLDADAIARELRQPGSPAAPQILSRFGTLDHERIREIVFSDENARRDLEAILHPLIRAESLRRLQELTEQTGRPAFYEAALIIESGRCADFDALWVVSAPEGERLRRIQDTRSQSQEHAQKIIQAQLPDTERRKHATLWIENSSSLEDLEKQIDSALTSWKPAP